MLRATLLASCLAASALGAEEMPLVVIQPVTLDAHPMSSFMPNAQGCAVDISSGSGTPQRVITVGEGESEMLSCLRFVEAGPLPALGTSIALIYDFESGPNRTFRGAVILTRDEESGHWYRNESHEGVLSVSGAYPSLSALREGSKSLSPQD